MTDAAPNFVQMAAGLAVVLLAIVALAWLARRITGGARQGSLIRIVASQPLGQRERVVLVEVAGEWMLLGVAPGAVRALKSLPRGEVPAPAVAEPFAKVLAAARRGKAS